MTTNEKHFYMFLWLIALERKHSKLSDSLEAELQAAAKEAGTDADTLRNKVSIFVIFRLFATIYSTANSQSMIMTAGISNDDIC